MDIEEVVDLTKAEDETDNITNTPTGGDDNSMKTGETASHDTVVDLTSGGTDDEKESQETLKVITEVSDQNGGDGGNPETTKEKDKGDTQTLQQMEVDGEQLSATSSSVKTEKEDETNDIFTIDDDEDDDQDDEEVNKSDNTSDDVTDDNKVSGIQSADTDGCESIETEKEDDFDNDEVKNENKTQPQYFPIVKLTRVDCTAATVVTTDISEEVNIVKPLISDAEEEEKVDDAIDGGGRKKRALDPSPDVCHRYVKISRSPTDSTVETPTANDNKNLLDLRLESKSSLDSLQNLLEDPASDIPSLNVDVDVNMSLENPTGTTKSILTRGDGPASGANSPFTDSLFNIVSDDRRNEVMSADINNDASENVEALVNETETKTKAPKRGRGRRGRGNNRTAATSTRSARSLNVLNFF